MIINVKDAVLHGVSITVPTWVNWVAVDPSGVAWGYELEPVKYLDFDFWLEGEGEQECPQQLFTTELNKKD